VGIPLFIKTYFLHLLPLLEIGIITNLVLLMKKIVTFFLLTLSILVTAQVPSGYYTSAVGKSEAALKTQLFSIVGPHTERTYADLWTDFQTTDKKADGKVWDMYSNCTFTFVTNQDGGSGGTSECQFYNREHSMPNSWFSKAYPMYSDLFHMYPTDKYVNNQRGNNPFGETTTPSATFLNGSKLGTSTFAGYSGTVYEPIDEYKGDFARTYFYMVTAYDDKVSGWVSDQLAGNQYPALSTWSVSLFLKWNSQDPVSTKETNRNEAVSGIQHNRNPFIDHPELAEYIWGVHKGEPWSLSAGLNELKISFSISPNPIQNELIIKSDEPSLSYTIYNLNGQILKEDRLNIQQSISVNELENGMYLVQLQSGTRKSIQKFIVNK
jgi:endonuclease I